MFLNICGRFYFINLIKIKNMVVQKIINYVICILSIVIPLSLIKSHDIQVLYMCIFLLINGVYFRLYVLGNSYSESRLKESFKKLLDVSEEEKLEREKAWAYMEHDEAFDPKDFDDNYYENLKYEAASSTLKRQFMYTLVEYIIISIIGVIVIFAL